MNLFFFFLEDRITVLQTYRGPNSKSSSSQHAEMFSKELVMTSDQASVKNMLLPKGYAYVPADCIPNEKQINQDACSGERPEGDG